MYQRPAKYQNVNLRHLVVQYVFSQEARVFFRMCTQPESLNCHMSVHGCIIHSRSNLCAHTHTQRAISLIRNVNTTTQR